MTDRVVRDEIFESDRWLDLANDTCRLAYFGFLLKRVDDYGNMEGGARRTLRFLAAFTEVRTEEDAQTVIASMIEQDMLRKYEVDGALYYHLPRLRPPKKYLVRKCPASPWDSGRPSGKELRQGRLGNDGENPGQHTGGNGAAEQQNENNQGQSPKISELFESVTLGVGVGVGVGEVQQQHQPQDQNLSGVAPLPAAGRTIPTWNAYSTAYQQRYRVPPIRNRSVNGHLAQFIARVGANDAPAIAAYYLGSNRGLYVSAKHATTLLVRDAEALRTEWLTQSHSTDSEARMTDKTAARGNVFTQLINEGETDGKQDIAASDRGNGRDHRH